MNPVPDVLDHLHELRIPAHVYIVGTGPSALPLLDRIPPDAYAVALNAAWAYPRAWDMALAYDLAAIGFPWFTTPLCARTRIVLNAPLVPVAAHCDYAFTVAGLVQRRKRSQSLPAHRLLGGGTSAGIALQICHHGGARHLTLLGIDMRDPDGREWLQLRRLMWLIRAAQNDDALIDTLSPSALDIPFMDEGVTNV